jgi:hypothetical protein
MEEENQGEKGGVNFEAVSVSGRVGEGAVAMGNLPEIVAVLLVQERRFTGRRRP